MEAGARVPKSATRDVRNPKFECGNPKQIRNPKIESKSPVIRGWDSVEVRHIAKSSFEFRISSFSHPVVSIELKDVTKRFGGVTAVRSVTFSVKEGELMALLGPSGGGKTTVLRMIAGLEMPTTGDVFIRGDRVNDLSVQERNIGFVFQNYALFKNMNVFKNVAFGLKIKKWKRAAIRARIA